MSLAFDVPTVSAQLRAAASEVMETMFFLELNPRSKGECDSAAPQRNALVPFTGGVIGGFRLGMSADTAQRLANDFLPGSELEDIPSSKGTVVGELANMICGNLLSRLGKQEIFHLSAPIENTALPVDRGHEDEAWNVENQDFETECGPIRISFRWKTQPVNAAEQPA
jgi:CheY-specific phosphatase CheX